MKIFKNKFLYAILLILCSILFANYSTPTSVVYASVDDPGYIHTLSSQTANISFSSLGDNLLYKEGDSNTTKAMYTAARSNTGWAFQSTTTGSVEFCGSNGTIYITGTAASSLSNRNPRATSVFSLSDELYAVAQKGYLKITLSAQLKAQDNTVYASLQNGSTKSTSGRITSTSWTQVTQTITNFSENKFTVIFCSEYGGSSPNYLYVNNPKIIITCTDSTPPSIVSQKLSDDNWAQGKKTLQVKVTDNETGIASVTMGNTTLTPISGDGYTNTYEIELSDNEEYSIEMTSKVTGKTQTSTLIPAYIDNQDVGILNIKMNTGYHEKTIEIDVEYKYDGLSAETIYYTLDGTTPNRSSKTLNVGKNTLTFENNGDYVLKAVVMDEVGHIGDVLERNFAINDTRFLIDVSVINGSYEITGADTIGEETNFHAWYGDKVTIDFTPNEGYEFYKVMRDGQYKASGDTSYSFTCYSDADIDIYFRYVVAISEYTSEYQFVENDTPIELAYTLNTTDEIDIATTYVYNESPIQNIYNAGDYTINWSIDNDDYIGSGSFVIKVLPISVTIEYLDNSNFVYNGQVQAINFTNIDYLDLNVSYFANNIETEFKNAGTYMALITCDNTNYFITNPTLENIVVSQKEIVATIVKTTFDYTSENQSIEYTLSEEIESSVTYYVGEDIVEFKNAQTYSYIINPIDTINYYITNNTGEAIINRISVYFVLDKDTYDYTGNVVNLQYSMYSDSEYTNAISFVNGLQIIYKLDDTVVDFKEPNNNNVYAIEFSTTDNNYDLFNTTFTAKITMVIINISLQKSDYEYTTKTITPLFTFTNEFGESISEANNITLHFYNANDEEVEFRAVGTYKYLFYTEDVNYQLIGAEGTLTINPTEVNIVVNNSNYIYSEEGCTLDYTITSLGGLDFTTCEVISLLFNNDADTTLSNAGIYSYLFASNDENIIIVSGEAGEVVISQKEITVQVVDSYTYTGSTITFEYSLSEEIEVVVAIDELLNVNTYNYSITSVSSNYIILENTGCVKVNPMIVTISSIDSEYCYTASVVELNVTLSTDISFTSTFTSGGDIVEFKNAGEYQLTLTSDNNNYVIVHDDITLVILPKSIQILAESVVKTYNKQPVVIVPTVEENVDVVIKYYLGQNEVADATNVGNYTFTIKSDDDNYSGYLEGTIEILAKNISVEAHADQYKIYGSSDTSFTYDIEGVEDGDTVNVVLEREEGEFVGQYEIKLVSFDNKNYNISYTSNYFKIMNKKIVVIADNLSQVYGDDELSLTYSIVGDELVGDDTLSGELIRESGTDAGTYEISLGTLSNDNYQIIFKSGIYTITPKALNIIIDNKSVEYGSCEQLTYHTDIEYDETLISGELVREVGDNVGSYVISGENLSSRNYALNITNAIYEIYAKSITVEAVNCSKVYGDNDNLEYIVTGLISGDTLTGALAREEGENVGTYAISLGTLGNVNYYIEFTPAELEIKKARLDIVLDDKSQVYGEEEKTLTYSISGLKFNDEIKLKLFRAGSNDVGEYPISMEFVTLENYYIDNFITATYTISKAKITPIIESTVFVYDGTSKGVNTSFPFDLEYVYKLDGVEVDAPIDAGVYSVQAIFNGNNNYLASRSSIVSLTITKQKVFFTLADNKFVYDGEVKLPEYSYNNSLNINPDSIALEFAGMATLPKEVGEYTYSISINDTNFEGSATGKLIIAPVFTVSQNDDFVIECKDATFDSSAQGITLVADTRVGEFNKQTILSSYKLENASADNDYIYTVKIKAEDTDALVTIYTVDENNNFKKLKVNTINGYYVFDVEGEDTQIIVASDKEGVSLITWIIVFASGLVGLIVVLIAFRNRKNKVKREKKVKISKPSEKDADIYNIN